ncbi:hypothetical protein [Sinomicrobium sp. M5D2P17]
MKHNILIKIKSISFLLLISFSLNSCLLDDDVTDFGEGVNLVGFSSEAVTVKAEANGEEVPGQIPVRIIGPSVNTLNGDVTVTVSVDPSSTAKEGVNYRLDSNTVTLSPDGSDVFEGVLPVTIITDGVETPVDEAPILNLTVTDVSSDSDLVINGKTSNVSATIAYTCPFDINDYAGTYLATEDEFGIYISEPKPFEVIVGPGENQITLVDVAAHPEKYDVIIDVDPETGDLTVPKQPALNTNNIGYTYGELRWEGSGSSAPSPGHCSGVLDLTSAYTVNAGSFGEFRIVFEKQ